MRRTIILLAIYSGLLVIADRQSVLAADIELTEIGRWPAASTSAGVTDMEVKGDLVYLTTSFGGLTILDGSNPERPVQVGHYDGDGISDSAGDWCEGLTTVGAEVLLLVSTGSGDRIDIVDATDPANISLLGMYQPDRHLLWDDIQTYDQMVVITKGAYGYSRFDAGVELIDISNPESPQWLSSYSDVERDDLWQVELRGHHLILGGKQSVQVIDISDASQPVRISRHTEWRAPIALVGDFAIVQQTDRSGEAVVVDISDPKHLNVVGSYLPWVWETQLFGGLMCIRTHYGSVFVAEYDGFPHARILGSVSGNVVRLVPSSDRLYVATSDNLKICAGMGLSNPQSVGRSLPIRSDHLFGNAGARRLAAQGDLALVAARKQGLYFIDISNASTPEMAGHYPTLGSARDVALVENKAVLIDGTSHYSEIPEGNRLVVLDVSNPQDPTPTGELPLEEGHSSFTGPQALDLSPDGNLAYVGSDDGVLVVSLANPTSPQQVEFVETDFMPLDIIVRQERLYLVGNGVDASFHIVDLSMPASPVVLSSYPVRGVTAAVEVAGNRAFLFSGSDADLGYNTGDGLIILDISDPVAPTQLGAIQAAYLADASVGLAVVGNHAYLTHEASFNCEIGPGLQVFDISDPMSPQLVGHNGSFDGRDVVAYGDHLLVASVNQGLVVLNQFIPAPERPTVTCLSRRSPDGLRLCVNAVPGVDLQLQRSTDLQGWTDWTEVRIGKDPIQLADPQGSPEGRRFYRAVVR